MWIYRITFQFYSTYKIAWHFIIFTSVCPAFSQVCISYQRGCSPHHASASSTTSPTPWSTCTGYESASASNSSCAHWLQSASAAQSRPTWLTCVSLCRRCPVALICVLPFTVTSSFRGLAWPAVDLAVSPSRVQRPGTVCRLIFATCLYPLPQFLQPTQG